MLYHILQNLLMRQKWILKKLQNHINISNENSIEETNLNTEKTEDNTSLIVKEDTKQDSKEENKKIHRILTYQITIKIQKKSQKIKIFYLQMDT